MSTTPVAVIVLAAGAGTRMKSDTPKMLHQIGGRSLLSHSLYAAKGLNPDHLVVVVGHQKELVEQAVEAWQEETSTTSGVALAHQEQQNGTGHAVMCGMDSDELAGFTGTVVVTNADVPLLSSSTLDSLVNAHTHAPAAAVTVLTVEAPTPTGYGRIIRNADGEVTAIVEEKDATEDQRRIKEVNTGVFAFDADVLRNSLGKLDTNNAQGEMYLTDVLGIARNEGLIARGHMSHDPAEDHSSAEDGVHSTLLGLSVNRASHILADAFKRNGLDERLAELYAQGMMGCVAMVAQWWTVNSMGVGSDKDGAAENGSDDDSDNAHVFPKDAVAAHIVNLMWNGLAGMEKDPILHEDVEGEAGQQGVRLGAGKDADPAEVYRQQQRDAEQSGSSTSEGQDSDEADD